MPDSSYILHSRTVFWSGTSQDLVLRESPGDLVHMQILTQKMWGETQDSAFLTSSQVMLMLPARDHTLSSQVLRYL